MEIHNKEELFYMFKEFLNSTESKSMKESGITREEAKHIVSKMFHFEGNRKFIGEKFDMFKAKEVHEKYVDILPSHANLCEVYIAINSHYHDYCELFKSWYGDNVEHKIIESAIVFWFKDADYPEPDKVKDYFIEEKEL